MRIEGYAVVGDDDRIADATGGMPSVLKNEAEWAFFQAGLDAADVTVLGRASQDATPNPKRRRRLVMTRSVSDVQVDGATVFWNPAGAALRHALTGFPVPVRHIAIAGGRDVFDHFLAGPCRFTTFHLSRVHGVNLPGGRGVFGAVESRGLSAAQVLTAAGYVPPSPMALDDGVDVVSWAPGSL